jgi:hypothetical protein
VYRPTLLYYCCRSEDHDHHLQSSQTKNKISGSCLLQTCVRYIESNHRGEYKIGKSPTPEGKISIVLFTRLAELTSLVKPKTIKLAFAAALPCTEHLEVKAKQKQKSSE